MAMVAITLELFRAGNKTSARFAHFVPNEIATESRNGVDWVLGPRQGGASTLEIPAGLRGTWYRLPLGTQYDDSIFYVWSDYAGHWLWEPAQDMQLTTYLDALTVLNADFIPV